MKLILPRRFSRLPVIFPMPAGMTPDKSAAFGLAGLISNVNNYSEALPPGFGLVTAGTNITLTAAQALVGITRLTAGASGGFTVTLPSTASMLSLMGAGNAVPTDGTYAEPISIMNDNIGQIGTLTAGDASTTLVGTMTVATNTRRLFLLTVTGNNTIQINNIGSMGL
jgi:hypothetical protein